MALSQVVLNASKEPTAGTLIRQTEFATNSKQTATFLDMHGLQED